MSRIGKKIILIPEKTEVNLSDGSVVVKGPLGELSRSFKPDISIRIEGKEISLKPVKNTNNSNMLWGTYASHITNMIKGVNEVFTKKLVVEGIGYKVERSGQDIVLNVGFSHSIKLEVPEGVNVEVEKNIISISGSDKEKVGQFTAKIRAVKKPEPYKGKGIRYDDEVVRRKQGKRAVT
ncbi:MAG: 50S ribosomal protein L6 [Candidatus Pacebacteria bacterium]|jgi:large subunit ribosomal protein L6|nr:50S ribosomal protein L6 [Candidatus Paceibacterota bacterium]|tara:strand:+ start:11050 stop:11586 length:537 start_codon:yes stop_codon:yes gene_type:complete